MYDHWKYSGVRVTAFGNLMSLLNVNDLFEKAVGTKPYVFQTVPQVQFGMPVAQASAQISSIGEITLNIGIGRMDMQCIPIMTENTPDQSLGIIDLNRVPTLEDPWKSLEFISSTLKKLLNHLDGDVSRVAIGMDSSAHCETLLEANKRIEGSVPFKIDIGDKPDFLFQLNYYNSEILESPVNGLVKWLTSEAFVFNGQGIHQIISSFSSPIMRYYIATRSIDVNTNQKTTLIRREELDSLMPSLIKMCKALP